MEVYERNLFIALCLGLRLQGDESRTQLDLTVREQSALATRNKVQPLQDKLAEWLDISIARCTNQQEASLRLWSRIDENGYGLVDVPMKLRRQAFGGSLKIQKRLGKSSWHVRLRRKLLSALKTCLLLVLLAAVVWAALKFFWK